MSPPRNLEAEIGEDEEDEESEQEGLAHRRSGAVSFSRVKSATVVRTAEATSRVFNLTEDPRPVVPPAPKPPKDAKEAERLRKAAEEDERMGARVA